MNFGHSRDPVKIKIVERKLQRHGVHRKHASQKIYGLAWIEERLIEIDPRQRPRCYLNTVIHELLHCALPKAGESRVAKTAGLIAGHLWRLNYRRVAQ